MKKIIALVAVCGFAFAFAACGKKAEPAAETVDTTTVVETVVADTTVADTTVADTTHAAH
jgi:predicted small lipoprotein YifL